MIRAYEPLVSLNKALLNPYFLRWAGLGGVGGPAMSVGFESLSTMTPSMWYISIWAYLDDEVPHLFANICQLTHTLHYITLHYITLHYAALRYNALHCISLCFTALYCTTLDYMSLFRIFIHSRNHTPNTQYWVILDEHELFNSMLQAA